MTAAPTHAVRRLRALNVGVGLAHLAQGVVILVLANDFATPVTATFLAGPPGGGPGELDVLADIRIGPLVAAFLLLAAADHLLMAVPPLRGPYERQVKAGRNVFRWIEYSVSASLMVVLIAMLTGISDIAALIALLGVSACMILFGILMEARPAEPGVGWAPFWFGCVAGAVPWIAIGAYLVGGDGTPGFVIGIFVSLFVFFNSFAVNMALRYRRVGPWRSAIVTETAYIWLSLGAKSALAWQVFASTLVA